jgi:lipopolysaccharide transport system permease protein
MTTTAESFDLHGETTPVRELLRDTWHARKLLLMLARKDFFVRYRRASFGLLWAVALPLFQAMVLAVVLPRILKIQSVAHYPVFVFSGILVWSFFANTLSVSATSIVDGADLSTKIYFPRAVMPLISVVSGAYGLLLSTAVFLGMCVVTGTPLGTRLVLLPLALALTLLLTASFGLVLSALQVYFRDVRYIVQAALLAWFYVTPAFYPLTLVGRLAKWIHLNPVTGVVELFRAATIGADPGWTTSLWWTAGWTAVLVTVALLLHRRFNRVFVDLL